MPFARSAIITPNRGLHFDRPLFDVPDGALIDGHNFRIKNGTLSNFNLGWAEFSAGLQLNGPVTFIDNFFPRDQDEALLFGTLTDIYLWDEGASSVSFLTPRYETGTAAASGTAVTGTGTDWDQTPVIIRAGDEITFGTAGVTDPAATWFTIDTVNNDTSITLTATAGTVVDGPYTIRRKFSGNLQDLWSFDIFVQDAVSGDDLWIATNGIDDVISWDGLADQVTLHPELGFTAKAVTNYSNMMIYINITDSGVTFPSSIINSEIGSPLLAGDTGTTISEQFRVHGGSDGLLNAVPLGDYLILYSDRHIIPMQFVGDPLVFIFRAAVTGLGPVGHNAIADFGDFHEFIGADAQYVFDGVTVKESNSQVWREIIRQTDPIRKVMIYGHFDEENGDLIWSVPSTLDADSGDTTSPPETAWSEHYLEDIPDDAGTPHSKRDFPFTASGFYERNVGLTWANAVGQWQDYNFSWNDQFFALGFPQNLVGDINGNIWILNESQTDGADAFLPSYVRFGRVPTGNGRERNLVSRVYPFATFLPGDLEVTVYFSDHAFKNATATGPFLYDMEQPEGAFFVPVYRRGRYFSVQFGTDGHAWQIAGYDYDLKKGGRR